MFEAANWHSRHRLERLWIEDDACRAANDDTRERIGDAWQRLFDEPFPGISAAIAKEDQGDCFLHRFPEGRVAEYSYEGEAIYQIKEMDRKEAVRLVKEELQPKKEDYDWLEEEIAEGDSDDEPIEPEAEKPSFTLEELTYGDLVLSIEQKVELNKLLAAVEAGQQILVLKGPAGCGKTTLAIALSIELSERGWDMRYMAPTGKAASRLGNVVRSEATTIHSALFHSVIETESGIPIFGDPEPMTEGDRVALFCDEASMVGSRLYQVMIKHIGPRGILIFSGDDKQLSPVADSWGPDFANPTAELTQIHRQAEGSPIIQAATLIRTEQPLPRESIGTGYIRHQGTPELAARWLIREMNLGNDAILLCFSNKTRQNLNRLVRHFTGRRKQGALVVNDRLLVLRNNNAVGRMNGETFDIKEMFPVKPPKGHKDQGVIMIRPTDGGPVVFTKPELIGASQDSFKKGRSSGRYTNPKHWAQLDYGYALTVHRSQGSEWKKVMFVLDYTFRKMTHSGTLSKAEARRLLYTAITRAKEQAIVLDVK